MTDTSMMEEPDDAFAGMMDPVEQQTIELLALNVQQLGEAVEVMKLVAQQQQQSLQQQQALLEGLARLVQVVAAERETIAIGRDGRELKGISRVKT